MASKVPKLVIFGDPRKGRVAEAIAEFAEFVKGKAEVVAECGIDRCTIDMLKEADFAVVFGGDGSITSAARRYRFDVTFQSELLICCDIFSCPLAGLQELPKNHRGWCRNNEHEVGRPTPPPVCL